MEMKNYYVGTGILANKIADAVMMETEKIMELQNFTIFLNGEKGVLVRMRKSEGEDRYYDFSDYMDRDLDTGIETLLFDWMALDILYDIQKEIITQIKKVA